MLLALPASVTCSTNNNIEEACNKVHVQGFPGEEAGNGIVDVLWSRNGVGPGGRVPLTWYSGDYLSLIGPELDYSMESGVGRTYRYLVAAFLPQYAFGYGMSYTTFVYSALRVTGPDVEGNVLVNVTLTNTGAVAGAAAGRLRVAHTHVSGGQRTRLLRVPRRRDHCRMP